MRINCAPYKESVWKGRNKTEMFLFTIVNPESVGHKVQLEFDSAPTLESRYVKKWSAKLTGRISKQRAHKKRLDSAYPVVSRVKIQSFIILKKLIRLVASKLKTHRGFTFTFVEIVFEKRARKKK